MEAWASWESELGVGFGGVGVGVGSEETQRFTRVLGRLQRIALWPGSHATFTQPEPKETQRFTRFRATPGGMEAWASWE